MDLIDEDRLEVGALYRKEVTVYLPAPPGTVAAYLSLRVDGVWTVTYTQNGVSTTEELAAPPGGGYQSGDVVYARQSRVDGPWVVDSPATVEDLSSYSGAHLQIRRKKDPTSDLVLEFTSQVGGGITWTPSTAPQLVLEFVVPQDAQVGSWFYDCKFLSATPRRAFEGKVKIVSEVTKDV